MDYNIISCIRKSLMVVYPQEADLTLYWHSEAPNGMLEAEQQEKINVTQKEKNLTQWCVEKVFSQAQGKQLLCHLQGSVKYHSLKRIKEF